MDNFTTYTTVGGDTWASVAFKAYGDAYLSKTIADANPTVKLDPILPAGIVLIIPVNTNSGSTIDISLMPPWKR